MLLHRVVETSAAGDRSFHRWTAYRAELFRGFFQIETSGVDGKRHASV